MDTQEFNRKVHQDTIKEHAKFLKYLKEGKCYICQSYLSTFDKELPCVHWLLRPAGFDKRHFPLIYKKFRYGRINSWCRWIANSIVPIQNINDLVAEKRSKKVIEETILYREYEWSFSCDNNDLKGHNHGEYGRMSHYHFQMKINGNLFIKYRDFHIPLEQEDIFEINVDLGNIQGVTRRRIFDSGMQEAITKIKPEKMLKKMRVSEKKDTQTWRLQTLLTAKNGKMISGDVIWNLIKKSKETGKPFASLVEELDDVSVERMITPGPAVPKIARRKDRKNYPPNPGHWFVR